MNEYIVGQYRNLLKRMGTQMVPTQWGYDDAEWNAVAEHYFSKKPRDEKKTPPVLANFIKNFDRFQHLSSLDHEAAGEYLADFIYAFHQSASAVGEQTDAQAKKGLQEFAKDLLAQLPLDEKGRAAFYVRLNVNHKIEKSLNLRMLISKTESEQAKKIIWPDAKTELEYNKNISEFFYPVMQALLNPAATDIEVVEEIEKLLKVVRVKYKNTGEIKDELNTPVLVFLTGMVTIAEAGPINSQSVKDRFYRAMHEVMNMPKHRKGVAIYKEQCAFNPTWLNDLNNIARIKPTLHTNYYHTIDPEAAHQEETEKKFNKSKWKSILLALSFSGTIVACALGIAPMALAMGLMPMYLGTVATGLRDEGGVVHHINKVFSFEWIKANQTPLICAVAAVAVVAIVFASVATSGALPLAAVIFTMPLMGPTSMGSFLLSFILPTVFSITTAISKKIFGDSGEKDYKDHLEMKELNDNIKKQRSELVLKETGEPAIESKSSHHSKGSLANEIEMDALDPDGTSPSKLTAAA